MFLFIVAGPYIISLSPLGEVRDKKPLISVTFSEPAVPLDVVEREIENPFIILPPVPGRARWMGTRTLVFIPDTTLTPATRYTVILNHEKIKGLKRDTSWTFETERPEVRRSIPADGSQWVSVRCTLYVEFNLPVEPSRVAEFIKLYATPGCPSRNKYVDIPEKRGRKREIFFSLRNPEGPERKRWKDPERVLVIIPEDTFPVESEIELTLLSGLPARFGELGMDKKRSIKFRTYNHFRILGHSQVIRPEEALFISFSNPVDVKRAKNHIEITPPVEFTPGGYPTRLMLSGNFLPKHTYHVNVKPGLPDRWGHPLKNGIEFDFTVLEYTPTINLREGIWVTDKPFFPVSVKNIRELEVFYSLVSPYRIPGKYTFRRFRFKDIPYEVRDTVGKEIIKIKLPESQKKDTVLDLRKFLGKRKGGLVLIETEKPQKRRALLQIRDFNLCWGEGVWGSWVWITRMKDGSPVPGVDVSLFARNGRVMRREKTDSSGFAILPRGGDYLVAEKNTHAGILERNGFGRRLYGGVSGFSVRRYKQEKIYVFTDRTLYRPGEKVHLKGVVRKFSEKGIETPVREKIRIEIKGPDRKKVFEGKKRLNSYGSFYFEISLPRDAKTGVYSGRVEAPEGWGWFYFRVEEYHPKKAEVEIILPSDTLMEGDTCTFLVKAEYLTGEPVRGAGVEWKIYSKFSFKPPPEFRIYKFPSGYWKEEVIASGKGVMDSSGQFTAHVFLNPPAWTVPGRLRIDVVVHLPEGRDVHQERKVFLAPRSPIPGIWIPNAAWEVGDTVWGLIVVLDSGGNPVKGREAEVTVWRRRGKEKIKLKEMRILTDTIPVRMEFVPEERGSYLVTLVVAGDTVKRSFYVHTKGRYHKVHLIPLSEECSPGDTACFYLYFPFKTSTCLLIFEGRELYWSKVIKCGRRHVLKIPVEEEHAPGIWISAVSVTRNSRVGYGASRIRVRPVSRYLSCKILPSRENFYPGERAQVEVEVRDAEGRGVKDAEVTLWVVDVGNVELTDYHLRDPVKLFYPLPPAPEAPLFSGISMEMDERWVPNFEVKKDVATSVSVGKKEEKIRKEFLTLVYYHPSLITDEDGKVRVSFKLPDNLTRYRIFVFVHTRDSKFGTSWRDVTVTLPFYINPVIPNIIRDGDEFYGGVVIHSSVIPHGRAVVEVEAEGVTLLERKKTVEVRNGTARVFFRMKAGKEDAVIRFRARMGRYRDAVEKKIERRELPLVETVSTFWEVEDSVLEKIKIPEDPEGANLEIELCGSILSGVGDGLRYAVKRYPYSCLEQLISRVFPLIVGKEIIKEFDLVDMDDEKMDRMIENVLSKVSLYQAPSGGYKYFKESPFPSPYLTAYVLYVLKRAEEKGYRVDRGSVKRALIYLELILQKEKEIPRFYPGEGLLTQAFSLYVLALWGRKHGWMWEELYRRRRKIPLEGKIYLLRAGKILRTGREEELLRDIKNALKISPTTAHLEEPRKRGWTLPSSRKLTALALKTFIDLGRDYPFLPMLARWLVVERKKGHISPHHLAFVFEALEAYWRKYEGRGKPVVGEVEVNGKEVMDVEIYKKPWMEAVYLALDTLEGDISVKIKRKGQGKLYYLLRMFYPWRRPEKPVDAGIGIKKRILTLDGEEPEEIESGRVYVVELTVEVPDERVWVVINDPLPAGFEVVPRWSRIESKDVKKWRMWMRHEVYFDRVIAYARHLSRGVYVLRYPVRAIVPGKFSLPPTMVQEMYTPSVFGRTEGRMIEVKEGI